MPLDPLVSCVLHTLYYPNSHTALLREPPSSVSLNLDEPPLKDLASPLPNSSTVKKYLGAYRRWTASIYSSQASAFCPILAESGRDRSAVKEQCYASSWVHSIIPPLCERRTAAWTFKNVLLTSHSHVHSYYIVIIHFCMSCKTNRHPFMSDAVSIWPPPSLLLLTTEQRFDWLLWIPKGLVIMCNGMAPWNAFGATGVMIKLSTHLSD